MTEDDFHRLARYNAEVAAGIVHTVEYDTRMAALQQEWDRRPGQFGVIAFTPMPDSPRWFLTEPTPKVPWWRRLLGYGGGS